MKVTVLQKSVFLPYEFAKGLPADKAFVPLQLLIWLHGSTESVSATVLVEPIIPPSVPSVRLISAESFIGDIENYLSRAILGFVVSEGETFSLSVYGRIRNFQVSLPDGYSHGQISKSTQVSLKKLTDSVSVNKAASDEPFSEVGGLQEVISELITLVKKPLTEPEKYKRYGVTPPKGVLLFGPPGTGKSLIARALARSLPSTNIRMVKATELAGVDAESKIHALFRELRAGDSVSSALVFIDEIDALCPKRDNASEAERRAVAALLTEMDGGISDSIPLVVLGATNRPNSIDLALRRAGRFEREIEVGVPDAVGRASIIRVLLERNFKHVAVGFEGCEDRIAAVTHGFVGADLQALLSRAASEAMETSAAMTLELALSCVKKIRPSALKELLVEIPTTHWSDIGGYQSVKQQLIEAVQWPTRYGSAFRSLGITPPCGVLLYGPPGCSKTMLARAVATEAEMNFVSVKGPELFSKWVGESEQAVRDLFRKARQAAPCVVFFDEVDAIGTERTQGGGVGDRVLAQLLTELDGVSGLKQVVLVAATNRPEALDSALMRPGRLDRLVHVGLPDKPARRDIWRAWFSKLVKDSDNKERLMDKFNEWAELLTTRTEGYTGAECVMVSREAAMLCIREQIDMSGLSNQLAEMSLKEDHTVKRQPVMSGPDALELCHFEKALSIVRPRIDLQTIAHYNDFEKQHSTRK